MELKYHQATFDLLGTKPRVSKRALRLIERREAALGITLPASLREWYSLQGAEAILLEHSNDDRPVPLAELGTAHEVRHGVLKFQDENQGVAAWYVRLDGSDDPPVDVESELYRGDSPETEDEDDPDPLAWAGWRPSASHFSAYIYSHVLAYRGRREDQAIAKLLRQDGADVTFDEQGRIVRVDVADDRDSRGAKRTKDRRVTATALDLLARAETLHSLWIRGGAELKPEVWAKLAALRSVSRLWLSGPTFGDEDVESLIAMPRLVELELGGTSLTEAGYTRLLRGKRFRSLYFTGRSLTDADLAGLGHQTRLEELDLSWTAITDEGLKALAGLRSLKRLSLSNVSVSGTGLKHLAGLRSLKVLDLSHSPVGDAGLRHLRGLERLEELNLRGTPIEGPGLRHLVGLSRLRELNLQESRAGDQGLASLARMTSLRKLRLADTPITDAGLARLKDLRRLEHLGIDRVEISDDAYRDLRRALPRLSISPSRYWIDRAR
jgi:hypothetical protein